MKRKATAVWKGDGSTGRGFLTTQSGVLNEQPYSSKTRFEDSEGISSTNPEELIAAAHAGCYSMALSFALANAGFKPEKIQTDSEVELTTEEYIPRIVGITLTLTATVPGIAADQFNDIAEAAKVNCPVSKALLAVPITLVATLV